jgi:pimeloyl-ACP methyl ester carboxylesterase
MASVTRRSVIGAALGAGAVALLAGCGGADVTWRSGRLTTSNWPGRELRWRLALPKASKAAPLVVVLHGRGGDADTAFDDLHLQDHVRRTGLAVASVDGGDLYWHRRRSGADPGAVVTDDLLPLLRDQTGYAGRVAFLGWSMGGYGSLLLASRLGPRVVGAVVAESAALWTEPGASAPGAFDDREDFEAHDVFAPARTRVLARIPVRLDCGGGDPFVAANRAFARRLPSAHLTVDTGGHNTGYWRDHAAAQLDWVAATLKEGRAQ